MSTLQFILSHPLNRNRKLKTVLKYACWQIGSRLTSRPSVVNFVNNTKLLVASGITGATGNIYCGLHEFEDMAFVLHALRKEDYFMNIGANVGSYTILASGVVGAKSCSCEPIPTTYDWPVKNVNINSLEGLVDTLNVGVGSEEGHLFFLNALDTVNHVLAADKIDQESSEVAVKPLDQIVSTSDQVMIKIDVEGYETKVIDGADETLKSPDCYAVIMELNGSGKRYGFDEQALHERMLGYGFRPFTYAPFERKLIPLESQNLQSGNTLYVKDVAWVAIRVKAADKFFVHGQYI